MFFTCVPLIIESTLNTTAVSSHATNVADNLRHDRGRRTSADTRRGVHFLKRLWRKYPSFGGETFNINKYIAYNNIKALKTAFKNYLRMILHLFISSIFSDINKHSVPPKGCPWPDPHKPDSRSTHRATS